MSMQENTTPRQRGPAPPLPVQAEDAPRLVRATVARGRTVWITTDIKRTAGHDAENKPVTRALVRPYAPGMEVELPHDEVVRLRKEGFLVDPNKTTEDLPAHAGPGNYELQQKQVAGLEAQRLPEAM